MSSIEYNGFSLQDINGTGVITSKIQYRKSPNRQVEFEKITRRPGVRIMNQEFAEKTVSIEGHVFGSSPSDLQTKIDSLNQNVVSQVDGTLAIDNSRTATATVRTFAIEENSYNTDYCKFSMEFLMADPFFYGTQHTVNYTLQSGSLSHTFTINISGSYYSYPFFTINMPSNTGSTALTHTTISYGSTGETVTWSGEVSNPTLDYGDSLQFDFNNQIITRNLVRANTSGSFAAFDPGIRQFSITFSGGTFPGGTASMIYQERYL